MKQKHASFIKLCLADALIKLMRTDSFDAINVNAICREANVGRTTFYRYFDSKSSKEDLLLYKIEHEWARYCESCAEADSQPDLTVFVYENRRFFTVLYENDLVSVIMRAMEKLLPADEGSDRSASYITSFFVYGYFGLIYQWIKYDFDEAPEDVKRHIDSAILAANAKK